MANKPQLWLENTLAWRAWNELTAYRPIGMGGPGFIPLTEVVAYCGIVGEDPAELYRKLRAVDAVYIKHWSDQQAARSENGTGNRT